MLVYTASKWTAGIETQPGWAPSPPQPLHYVDLHLTAHTPVGGLVARGWGHGGAGGACIEHRSLPLLLRSVT